MLSDLLESLIGALYRDQGLEACQRFVLQQIINTTELSADVRLPPSRKSALISHVNTRGLGHISYKTKPKSKTLGNGLIVNTWTCEVTFCRSCLTQATSNARSSALMGLVAAQGAWFSLNRKSLPDSDTIGGLICLINDFLTYEIECAQTAASSNIFHHRWHKPDSSG